MASGKVDIEVTGIKPLKRALRVLGEADAPHLRAALERGGELLSEESEHRAPGRIARSVRFVGVRGKGGALRAVVKATHPGAKAMEFGRRKYYRGFTGRQMKATGTPFKANPGQRARPFAGIARGDAATGAVAPKVRELLAEAVVAEWDRIGRQGESGGE